MVQSVELLLDGAGDAAVRADWELLEDVGLRTPVRRRTGATRPHITLAVADRLSDEVEQAISDWRPALPAPLVIGGLLIFGGRRLILARSVAPSRALIELQHAAAGIIATAGAPPDNMRPDRWTPHITLARDVDGPGLARACRALPDRRIHTAGIGLRRWDGRQRSERLVAGHAP